MLVVKANYTIHYRFVQALSVPKSLYVLVEEKDLGKPFPILMSRVNESLALNATLENE